jgi:hypothetical protein
MFRRRRFRWRQLETGCNRVAAVAAVRRRRSRCRRRPDASQIVCSNGRSEPNWNGPACGARGRRRRLRRGPRGAPARWSRERSPSARRGSVSGLASSLTQLAPHFESSARRGANAASGCNPSTPPIPRTRSDCGFLRGASVIGCPTRGIAILRCGWYPPAPPVRGRLMRTRRAQSARTSSPPGARPLSKRAGLAAACAAIGGAPRRRRWHDASA